MLCGWKSRLIDDLIIINEYQNHSTTIRDDEVEEEDKLKWLVDNNMMFSSFWFRLSLEYH